MAETLYFSIPPADIDQPEPHYALWYQSDDGSTWDETAVDTVTLSTLPIDVETGKYIWTTSAPDPFRFHNILASTIDNIESLDGIVIPPQEYPGSNLSTTRISDGLDIYSVGQTVDLMLQVDPSVVESIGESIPVRLVDNWGNPVGYTTATQISAGTGFYIAQYTIPGNLTELYNIYGEDESGFDGELFYLKDIWLLDNNTQLAFSVYVSRVSTTAPVASDSVYVITMDNINNQVAPQEIAFTSSLTKYYAPVEDLYSYMPALESADVFDIVRQIMRQSEYVDIHMRPDVIHDLEAYNSAVRCYVGKQTAMDMVATQDAGLTSETKTLDSMQVSRSYDSKTREVAFKADISKCIMTIYAGGRDTLFNTKLFVKGIYDPNRPQVGRGRWDEVTNTPFLNYTSKPILITHSDGSVVEHRGMRTVGVVV